MKVTLVSAVVAPFAVSFAWKDAAHYAPLTPVRLSWDALRNDNDQRWDHVATALSQHGILVVTHLSDAHRDAIRTMALVQDACLSSLESSMVRTTQFPDGTLRRTLATRPDIPFVWLDGINIPDDACRTWNAASRIVRTTTLAAVHAVGEPWTRALEQSGYALPQPLLHTAEGMEVYRTLSDVVAHGDYLEHFHSYHTAPPTESNKTDRWTIDLHTDQGLFLAFVPARSAVTGQLWTNDDFVVQTSDGVVRSVALQDDDGLVFVLGDAMHAVVNQQIQHHAHSTTQTHERPVPLRPAPHAVKLHAGTGTTEARVWYGLMVLPPPQAIHPTAWSRGETTTFGDIRRALASNDVSSNDVVSLACSPHDTEPPWSTITTTRRTLADTMTADQCNNDTQLYCWHTCQNLTADVSVLACDHTLRQLACVDATTQLLWSGRTSGEQYVPQCVDLTAQVEVVPTTSPVAAPTATVRSSATVTTGSSGLRLALVGAVALWIM